MGRRALLAILLGAMLLGGGCSGGTPEPQSPAAGSGEKTAVETRESVLTEPETGEEGTPAEAPPEIIIKTPNQVSNQEAEALLEELDQELEDLLDTLEQMDEVEDPDLQYQEGGG